MLFSEQFTIQIRDINYGQHLDHLALLGYIDSNHKLIKVPKNLVALSWRFW
jgi:hypothetical protein